MKVVITGGGTGGHLFPAIEMAREFRKNYKADVFYFGNENYIEGKVSKEENIPFYHISSKSTLKKDLKFVLKNTTGVLQAIMYLKKIRPDFVFSTGGFTTAPVLAAAKILGIPYYLHEQNAVMGLVNRLFSKNAKCVFHSFPIQKNSNEVFVGNISRFQIPRSQSGNKIVIMGGSGGSRVLNELAFYLSEQFKEQEFLLIAGRNYENLNSNSSNLEVVTFVKDMEKVYQDSKLIITRAGATSLIELSALGIPVVLVPMPNSADNHQYKNAQYYSNQKAAILVQEDENLKVNTVNCLNEVLDNKLELMIMSQNMRGAFQTDTKERIVNNILSIG